jgi:hypothetical protein
MHHDLAEIHEDWHNFDRAKKKQIRETFEAMHEEKRLEHHEEHHVRHELEHSLRHEKIDSPEISAIKAKKEALPSWEKCREMKD